MKIQSFTDLITWKKAHQLILEIYKITMRFPKSEVYGLSSQMRCSSISITSNIAEGFSRKGKKEKIQFYYMASGSLSELINQIIIAKDVGYLKADTYKSLQAQSIETHKLLNALIRSTKIS
jgi:four helix bundle protein